MVQLGGWLVLFVCDVLLVFLIYFQFRYENHAFDFAHLKSEIKTGGSSKTRATTTTTLTFF